MMRLRHLALMFWREYALKLAAAAGVAATAYFVGQCQAAQGVVHRVERVEAQVLELTDETDRLKRTVAAVESGVAEIRGYVRGIATTLGARPEVP